MRFTTSLRPPASRRLEEIGNVDLLIGIPCYNNQLTVGHVIRTVSEGLYRNFPKMRSLVMVSDGGSTDDTREMAEETETLPYVEKVVSIYRGAPGKGTALRAIFEACEFLQASACAVVDSDLRSITPEWVRFLLEPVLEKDFHFVAPLYTRYKYDGTITNNVVYNLTRALFGVRIRQPIGGDFGFSRRLARYYAMEGDWESDIAKFGVDIWMTISAMVQNLPICQSHLGSKIHDAKDPGASLGPMFRQVVFTMFSLMDRYYDYWQHISGSQAVPTFGKPLPVEPEPFTVDVAVMIKIFKEGYEHFSAFWKEVLQPENFSQLTRLYESSDDQMPFTTAAWAKIVYDFFATFHAWERHRRQLVDTMSPLYYARVASFVIKTREMNNLQAEEVVEDQALQFEKLKPYLLEAWQRKSSRK